MTPAVGDRMMWDRESRGGYGFISRLPVVVVAVGPKRIGVLVLRRPNEPVRRWVDPAHLSPRDKHFAIDDLAPKAEANDGR
jgi:hypothetical protein